VARKRKKTIPVIPSSSLPEQEDSRNWMTQVHVEKWLLNSRSYAVFYHKLRHKVQAACSYCNATSSGAVRIGINYFPAGHSAR